MKSKVSRSANDHETDEIPEFSESGNLESDSDCSLSLARARQEIAEKDTMISELQKKIQFMEQKASSLEQIIAQKEKKLSSEPISAQKPSIPSRPSSPSLKKKVAKTVLPPDVLYQNSHIFLKKRQFADARQGFTILANQFPDHDLADNALYWLGECHYAQKKYTDAVQTFQTLIDRYPKADKVPDALLKAGYSYAAMDEIDQARKYLSLLLKHYPFSQAASKAEKKLNQLN